MERMAYDYEDSGQRAVALRSVTKVVIKIGTRLLTDVDGVSKAERVRDLVRALAGLRRRGLDVILVSSGAIGAGMSVLGTPQRPHTLALLQAHAAVGQSRLMSLYESACAEMGFHCAQLLLTAADVQDRDRHLNVASCLGALLSKGVLPIINENDAVSVAEIKFGDNDILAALAATMLRADLSVLLTTVDGMWERREDGFTRRLSVVRECTPELAIMAAGPDGNRFSVGGMRSKLRAAEIVTQAGEPLWVADGRDFGVLEHVFAGADVGTLFLAPKRPRMRGHKRFLAFFSAPVGAVIVDAGAEKALTAGGRSLLASGVVGVRGSFARADTLRILNSADNEIGRGITNYSDAEVTAIRGCQSHEIGAILNCDAYDAEVIHRDYLVLTGQGDSRE